MRARWSSDRQVRVLCLLGAAPKPPAFEGGRGANRTAALTGGNDYDDAIGIQEILLMIRRG